MQLLNEHDSNTLTTVTTPTSCTFLYTSDSIVLVLSPKDWCLIIAPCLARLTLRSKLVYWLASLPPDNKPCALS